MSNPILTEKELTQHKGLWHGMKTERFLQVLEEGVMKARTMQRYWKDGKFFFDDDRENYENSFFFKGWSTTRDKHYAFAWGDVTLLLDEEAIKRDFKIRPLSWAATMRHSQNTKMEREEFIIAELFEQTFDDCKDEFYDILDNIEDKDEKKQFNELCDQDGFIGYWRRPSKNTIDFNNYVKGFFLRSDPYGNSIEVFEELKKHPLFLGFYSKQKSRDLNKQSQPKYNHRLQAA